MPILEGFELQESVKDATEMWGNDQVVKNFTAKAETANAILSKQTAKNEALTSTEKDNIVKVRWMNFTDETVSTFVNATGPEVCNLDGPEVTSDTATYALDTFVEKSFKVEETGSGWGHGFRALDTDFQSAVKIGLLKTRKALVEDLNKRVLAKLDTFTGTNKYMTATFKDDATTPTGDTIIPAASFNARTILPYLARVQMMNKYVDPYMLDGGLLYDDFYISQFGSTASDAVKLQSLFGQFDITQDMWGFSEASLDDRLYLVDKNAIGLFHKHTIAEGKPIDRPGDRKDYTMALPELGNNVTADVHYQYKCEGNKYYHVWKLVLRYGLLANPVIEDTDLTGVLAFRKGA